jgi:1,4-dihydroxy-2-naphthoate octaprenyltransferase
MALQKSSLQLLRIHFSFFLMPVYWFALSQTADQNWPRTLLVFVILHLLVYPASNGYNSYMDRDTTPIGGLERPLQPTRQLFRITVGMDMIALLSGLFVSPLFSAGLGVYILASRAYSYRGIRLKRHPVIGFLTVIVCQGALVFFLVYYGCSAGRSTNAPLEGMIISTLLIGGFYPLTQVYQHEVDRLDGVRTISMLLGIRGSFIFTAAMYTIAMLLMSHYFIYTLQIREFYVLATCMLPILVYFFVWAVSVWKDPRQANFKNTMRMNLLASLCTNASFIAVLVMNRLMA